MEKRQLELVTYGPLNEFATALRLSRISRIIKLYPGLSTVPIAELISLREKWKREEVKGAELLIQVREIQKRLMEEIKRHYTPSQRARREHMPLCKCEHCGFFELPTEDLPTENYGSGW